MRELAKQPGIKSAEAQDNDIYGECYTGNRDWGIYNDILWNLLLLQEEKI